MASQGACITTLHPIETSSQTAFEYERNHDMRNLQPFFDSSLPFLRHPEVKEWGEDLARERQKAQESAATQDERA